MTVTIVTLFLTCIGVGVARSIKAESVVRLGLPPITHVPELPTTATELPTTVPTELPTTARVQTPLVPLLNCNESNIFNIGDYMRVYVCRDVYVDIRKWDKARNTSHIRYNAVQWHKFTMMMHAIEQSMGIFRLDESHWMSLKKIDSIDLCAKGGCLTMTTDQWFQLTDLTNMISTTLGLKAASPEQV